jgi:hypothetical protein
LPFRGDTSGLIFDAILNRAPLDPVRLNPDLPPKLEDIINRALEKDRNLRYQHASDMRAELQRLKRDTESGTTAVLSTSEEETAQLARVATRSPSGRQKASSATKPALTEDSGASPWRKRLLVSSVLLVVVAIPILVLNTARFRLSVFSTMGKAHVSGVPPKNGTSAAENMEAYDLYLRGREMLRNEKSSKEIETALHLYEDALKKDPRFALAYTGIGDASLEMYEKKKEPFWVNKALAAAKQAQQINDSLPEVHLAIGSVYLSTGKFAEAAEEMKRAVDLAPNSDEAYRRLGRAYLRLGKKNEAIEAYQKTIQIGPYYWRITTNSGART